MVNKNSKIEHNNRNQIVHQNHFRAEPSIAGFYLIPSIKPLGVCSRYQVTTGGGFSDPLDLGGNKAYINVKHYSPL